MKKFGIIGPGAVGTSIAYALQTSNLDVTLFGRENGTVLFQEFSQTNITTMKVHALKSTSNKVDLLFIAVKTTQLDDILPYINNVIHDDTVIILTQNGYGQIDKIQHPLTYQAVVYISGQKDNHTVTHFRDWTLKLPINEHTRLLQDATKNSMINVECIEDYDKQVWYKLIVNLGINTITAITQKPAVVLQSEGISELCYNLLAEGKMVALAEGIQFEDNLEESIMQIYKGYPDEMGTSMYYDTMNHRPLELEYIQGYIYQISKKHHLNTPLLDSTYAILNTY